MTSKLFEIRDRGTMIVVLATRLDPADESERFLLGWTGYGPDPGTQSNYVVVTKINGGALASNCSPNDWGHSTMRLAHKHIVENFGSLESGSVVCTEFLRGERSEPKIPTRLEMKSEAGVP